jgi:hypothetical protein
MRELPELELKVAHQTAFCSLGFLMTRRLSLRLGGRSLQAVNDRVSAAKPPRDEH